MVLRPTQQLRPVTPSSRTGAPDSPSGGVRLTSDGLAVVSAHDRASVSSDRLEHAMLIKIFGDRG